MAATVVTVLLVTGAARWLRLPSVLVTVLGSCVAACIQDRTAGIGGMNHFMLPDDGADAGQPASDSMRYGAYAMEVLINELIKAGGRRERFEAKVFGGGAVLAGMTTMNIGDRNSEFVRRYLALEKIRIVAEDLQGNHPRKVAFMPRTGQVMVKKLRLQQEAGVAEREQALVRQSAEARAERLARSSHRDVHVGAQVAVLHVAVAGAEIAHDLAQLGDIGGRFLGAADVGARDDLHQRDAGAVQVHEGQAWVHVVDRLARVLFQVDAFDAHAAGHAGGAAHG